MSSEVKVAATQLVPIQGAPAPVPPKEPASQPRQRNPEKLGATIEETCALGDDLVDIEMLEACGHPITHAEAREPVRDAVAKRGGYVARGGGHAGTAEMLRETLRWLQK